ncbi:MAG: polyprenyl synthetase family protein [Lachnospiraceae bacterium]|nr:polyprenyl synthetase family protein [Lachnospiraceae bacterium]
MNFNQELDKKIKKIEEILMDYLPLESGFQKTVLKAMNYSILAGGKRLRPLLMLEAYQMFGGKERIVEPFVAAIEMVHTYSLVHDDLPCMDDDEYRRGKKTTHAVYGQGMALLAGDGLLNLAYETAAEAVAKAEGERERLLAAQALVIFAKKAGVYGMIGGQVADIEAEGMGQEMTMQQLTFIHAHKTAALIQAALMVGATLAGASEEMVKRLEDCGYQIGLAFQIQDDILDVTGSLESLGKPIGSDAKNNKKTYVEQKGLEEAKRDVESMSAKAIGILESFQEYRNRFLECLVRQLITREK